MKLFALKFYIAYLLVCSFFLIAFIIVGSHGRLLLNNRDTMKGMFAISIFVATAVLIYYRNRFRGHKIKRYLPSLFSFFALCILIYLASTVFYPDIFTMISSVFFLFQLSGIFFGLVSIYNLATS